MCLEAVIHTHKQTHTHTHTRSCLQAYDLMWELKHLFDPTMTINPGVVLNRDPDLHMKNLKQAPAASPIVDR